MSLHCHFYSQRKQQRSIRNKCFYFTYSVSTLYNTGTPNLKFEESMQSEHCNSFDSLIPFTTNNYGITTTPMEEWNIVVNCDTSKADMQHGRRLQKIEDLLIQEEAKGSKLSKPEVISAVLYTGPMVGFLCSSAQHACLLVLVWQSWLQALTCSH